MTRGALRLAAVATIALVAAGPLALNRLSGTAGVAPQVERPIVDTQSDATIATETPAASAPMTVPPTTIAVPAPAPSGTPTSGPPATTVVTTTSAIGTRALGLIRYPWTKLGYPIFFHGPKAGFFGLTDCQARRIDIYVASGQTVAQVAYVTAFEIAHAIDCSDQVAGHR